MVRQGAMGLAAMVSALTCACTSASTGGPPAIAAKPPLTGDARAVVARSPFSTEISVSPRPQGSGLPDPREELRSRRHGL